MSDRAMTAPPVEAALERLAVHVVLADELRLVGEQASEVKVADATRLMVAFRETPLRLAVTMAL